MVKDQSHPALVRKVTRILRAGGTVLVYGWMAKNHSKQTRRFEQTGRIVFMERQNNINSMQHDFTIFTRFIEHADQQQLEAHLPDVYKHCLNIGQIKKILDECRDLIMVEKSAGSKPSVPDINEQSEPTIEDLEATLMEDARELNPMEKFAVRFRDEAVHHSDEYPLGRVSAPVTSRLLKEAGVEETPQSLIKSGWLDPIRSEGARRVGWYAPGSQLEVVLNGEPEEEPDDPIDKARYLIKRKSFWNERIAELQGQIDECQKEVDRADAAEALLSKLEEL
jgi:hypothetical protein